jgi:hypothetical protein
MRPLRKAVAIRSATFRALNWKAVVGGLSASGCSDSQQAEATEQQERGVFHRMGLRAIDVLGGTRSAEVVDFH